MNPVAASVSSADKGLRINVRLKYQGNNVAKFKYAREDANLPFTTRDLDACVNKTKDLFNSNTCDAVFFTVKGKHGETNFGRAAGGKVRLRTELSPENVSNGEGVKTLCKSFCDQEVKTPGFFSYKWLRINVRFKFEGENTFKFKHIPEHAKVPFTPNDLIACVKATKTHLADKKCDAVFFTVKGQCGETIFGTFAKGKTRERTQIAPADVLNDAAIATLTENFRTRVQTTPGFFKE